MTILPANKGLIPSPSLANKLGVESSEILHTCVIAYEITCAIDFAIGLSVLPLEKTHSGNAVTAVYQQ